MKSIPSKRGKQSNYSFQQVEEETAPESGDLQNMCDFPLVNFSKWMSVNIYCLSVCPIVCVAKLSVGELCPNQPFSAKPSSSEIDSLLHQEGNIKQMETKTR